MLLPGALGVVFLEAVNTEEPLVLVWAVLAVPDSYIFLAHEAHLLFFEHDCSRGAPLLGVDDLYHAVEVEEAFRLPVLFVL